MQLKLISGSVLVLAVLSSAIPTVTHAESRGDTMEQPNPVNASQNEPEIDWEFAKSHRNILEFCTLVCAQQVDTYLATEEQLDRAADGLRELCVTKVYLETYRSGHRSQDALLRQAKEFFLKEGFDVGGCITPTAGGDFGTSSSGSKTWLCYSSEKTRADMAEITAYTATLFDEVMFDDFLCTACRCDTCRKLKKDATWSEFRLRQMTDFSREFILKPAHTANPNAKIIIKYPQWYDKFHDMGYAARAESDAFDYVWIGTETRNPDTPRFGFVEPYESYFIYRWLGSVAAKKTRGGWFDVYDCTPRNYVHQAYQTVLAGAREILLFNFYETVLAEKNQSLMTPFKANLPRLYELAEMIRGKRPRGIHAYKPVNSDAATEDFIFDYIGMLGIPLVPCCEFPTDARSLLLTTHATTDAGIVRKVRRHVASGGSLVATPGFLRVLATKRDMTALFGWSRIPDKEKTVTVQTFDVAGRVCTSEEPIEIVLLPQPSDASTIVSAVLDDGAKVPVLTVRRTDAGGRAITVNLRTHDTGPSLLMNNRVSFLKLPAEVVNKMREAVLPPIGLEMVAPARVGLYPFSDNLLVLYNYNDRPLSARLRFFGESPHLSPRTLFNPWREQQISPSEQGWFEIRLDPDEIAPLRFE